MYISEGKALYFIFVLKRKVNINIVQYFRFPCRNPSHWKPKKGKKNWTGKRIDATEEMEEANENGEYANVHCSVR